MKILHLASMILAVTLLASPMLVGSTSSAGVYNPWYDLDGDGDIDIFDVVKMAGIYGTSGEPYEAKAAIEYDSGWIDITDKCGQCFNITHNLNSTDVMVDVTGKTTLDGGVHQRNIGGTSYTHWWSKTYGGTGYDGARSVVQTGDGGYAIAGSTESGVDDFWLVKTDFSGNVEWSKTYGGTSLEDAFSMIQTGDGGYALTGRTLSYGAGGWDAWLVKTYANGTMEWSKTYGGIDLDYGNSVVQTGDGGYAIAGYTYSFGASSADFWLVKTDSNGTMQWSKTYGGTDVDYAKSVVQTNDGGYALAGWTCSFGAVGDDAYLVKTDSFGNMQWNETYALSGGTGLDEAYDLIQTSDGGYALVGAASSFDLAADFWLVKTDTNGNMQWNGRYGGTDNDYAYSVVQTGDGGYAIAGTIRFLGTYSDFWLVKTDAKGNAQWNKTYGGTGLDDARSMVQTGDGGYAIAGYTYSFGASSADFLLVRTEIESGLAWTDSTADTITLCRGATDPYWNFVRVRIWKIKEP